MIQMSFHSSLENEGRVGRKTALLQVCTECQQQLSSAGQPAHNPVPPSHRASRNVSVSAGKAAQQRTLSRACKEASKGFLKEVAPR